MSKSYCEMLLQAEKMLSRARRMRIRITLVAISQLVEKSASVIKLERKFYVELSKPIRLNAELDDVMDELWELIPVNLNLNEI